MIDIKLSLIIPVFNDSVGLKRLFLSIAPTDDIEILVIDDNSTTDVNDLRDVIEFAKNRYQNFQFYKNDKGVQSAGACRNIGLKKACGKWFDAVS